MHVFDEFRDRIYEQSSGPIHLDNSLYTIVATKLFGFAFNTYKAVGLLLPQHFYEQGGALYRTLWETGANFEWVSRDPELRSHLFLNFTLIEHQNFLSNRIRTAKRSHDAEAVLALTRELADFECLVRKELSEFESRDRKGKVRSRRRFSSPTLDEVIREIGGDWLDEYDRDYRLGSSYTHGAPSGILFPMYHDPALTELWDLERSALMAIVTMHAMIRIDRLWLAHRGMDDSAYLAALFFRLRDTATA